MKRIGKIGKANILANKKIKEQLQYDQINYCEMRLDGCMVSSFLQIAHRHKRAWYKGEPDLLADKNQWVLACHNCHEKTEWNRELNDEVFNRLRPCE